MTLPWSWEGEERWGIWWPARPTFLLAQQSRQFSASASAFPPKPKSWLHYISQATSFSWLLPLHTWVNVCVWERGRGGGKTERMEHQEKMMSRHAALGAFFSIHTNGQKQLKVLLPFCLIQDLGMWSCLFSMTSLVRVPQGHWANVYASHIWLTEDWHLLQAHIFVPAFERSCIFFWQR